jgi:leucyl aminopeptidase (aminopeptidase T)
VFTELQDLSKVSGDIMVWGFPNLDNNLRIMKSPNNLGELSPFRVTITDGLITDYDRDKAPEEFGKLLEKITSEDGCVRVREFGLGLNKAMGPNRLVSNTTAFERQHGLHLSIGR